MSRQTVQYNSAASPAESTHDIAGSVYRVFASASRSDPASPTYVLIHGIGTSHRYMAKLHAQLALAAAVYSVGIPGFGGLPKPDHAPDVAEVAAGVGTILDRFDLHRVVVIGHSMGAQWAVELGILRPDRVAAVVMIGPVADDEHRSLLGQGSRLALDVFTETPAVNALVLGDYIRCGVVWFMREVRFMLSYPIEKRVAELRMPLLVVRGGNDPIAGIEWCRRLRAAAERASFVTIPGHGHVAQFTAPRAIAAAIEAFLVRHEQQPVPPGQ